MVSGCAEHWTIKHWTTIASLFTTFQSTSTSKTTPSFQAEKSTFTNELGTDERCAQNTPKHAITSEKNHHSFPGKGLSLSQTLLAGEGTPPTAYPSSPPYLRQASSRQNSKQIYATGFQLTEAVITHDGAMFLLLVPNFAVLSSGVHSKCRTKQMLPLSKVII